MRIRAIVWCFLVVFSFVSCGTGEDEWIDLADGVPDEPGSGLERVRARQLLRVPVPGGGTREVAILGPNGTMEGASLSQWWQPINWSSGPVVDAATFEAWAGVHMRCLEEEWFRSGAGAGPTTSPLPQSGSDICRVGATIRTCPTAAATSTSCGCEEAACEMRINNCKVNLLLEMATGEADVELTAWSGNAYQRIQVPPQNIETRAALAEAALRQVAHQVQAQAIGSNIYFADASCTASARVDAGATSMATGRDLLMSLYAELPELAREAGELAASTYRSIATSMISNNVSFSRGAREAHEVSLYGARLLVGGFNATVAQSGALPGAVCQEPQLSNGGEEALRVLRSIGLPPSDVTSTSISIDDFLYRPTGPSVVRRYLVQAGRLDEFGTLTRDQFLAELGLTRDDFAEARRVESEYIRAYRRDMTATVGDLAGEAVGFDTKLYAATSRPPLPMAPGELGAIASTGTRISTSTTPQTTVVDVGAVLSRWYAKVHAAQTNLDHPTIRAARESLWGQLGVGATLSIVSPTYTQVVVQGPEITSSSSPALIRPFVAGDQLRFAAVVGTPSMRCATQGAREGVPCTWADDVISLPWLNQSGPQITYRRNGAFPTGADNWVYLLRLKPGAAPNAPGSYAVAAAWLPTSTTSFTGYAVEVSDLHAQAGELIMPSEAHCARPRQECGDISFDGRIPLEDELTDDGDAFESSWRRYLTLARAAANEADALGEAALNSQLDVEARAEEAAAELESLCGVSIDVSPLTSAIAADPARDPLALLESLAVSNASLRGLQQCLGVGGTLRYTALGSDELCAWYPGTGTDRSREGELCGLPMGTTTSLACPRRLGPEDATTCRAPVGTTAVRIRDTGPATIRDGLLGLFNPPPTADPPQAASPSLCKRLRWVSGLAQTSGGGSPNRTVIRDFWRSVAASEERAFFSAESFKNHGASVRWEARPDTHSALFVGDQAVATTGDVYRVGTTGLCSSTALPECTNVDFDGDGMADGNDTSSLFCSRINCGSETERALRATRHARAAIVARWLAQSDLSGFVLPEVFDTRVSNRTAVRAMTNGSSVWTFSTTSANPRRDHYCHAGLSEGSPVRAFRYSRNSVVYGNQMLFGLEDGVNPFTRCDDNQSIAFYQVTSEKPFGHGGLRNRVVDAHRLRAVAVSERLPTLMEEPRFAGGFDGAVQTLICRERECGDREDYEFPWVRVVDGAVDVETQIRRHAARFFLDTEGTELPEDLLYDALDLMCEASQVATRSREIDIGVVSNRESLAAAATQLENGAALIKRRGSEIVVHGLPSQVYDLARGRTSLSSTDGLAGSAGAQVIRLKAALEEVAIIPGQIGAELDSMARDTRAVDLALRRADNDESIQNADFAKEVSDRLTACVVEITRAATVGVKNATGNASAMAALAAVAVCTNSVLQINFSASKLRSQLDNTQVDRLQAFLEFERATAARAENLEQLEARLRTAVLEMQASIMELEVLRNRARRLLAQALFLEGNGAGIVYRTNTFLRRRLSTERERYRRARRNAIGMTWLAKTAIEQRFGAPLSSFENDLTLVEAPARWESSLCTAQGMDFDRILEGEAAEGETTYDFVESYVGEYVRNLELFVESYRLDFPFQNASDTAVVSLRDDVANVRGLCLAPVHNLLYHANELRQGPTDVPGWTVEGCPEVLVDGEMQPVSGCADLHPAEGYVFTSGPTLYREGPPLQGEGALGIPQTFRVTFGLPGCNANSPPGCVCENCNFTPGANIGQTLYLTPGAYRVSWYGAEASASLVRVRMENGADAGVAFTWQAQSRPSDDGTSSLITPWFRYVGSFTVPVAQEVRVMMIDNSASPSVARTSFVAGLMLEALGDPGAPTATAGTWASTGATLEHPQPVCEDTFGEAFQPTWRRNCIPYCADGFGRDCTPVRAEESCYWETEVRISQRQLDRGEVLGRSGFAEGNFNYRINGLGLNFVGTELRDCSRSAFPSTCYSGGYIPYSIEHVGPYTVRNHMGDAYDAPLFTGNIEHARGLAAERYLTNPLSGADRGLIEPYMQRQFRGRPLAGTYRIRVWEVDGIDFEQLEDVQLVLDYGFWTRFR